MARIGWVDGVGYVASLLVFCTFYMKTMIPLRSVAIASNVAFMTYGFTGRLYPVLVLHSVLLPLNCLRLRQMLILIRKVREASRGNLSTEWLIPLMTHHRFESGHVLFRKGEPATSMYMVLEGSVRIVELDVALGPGALVGEMGVFAPDNRRTATAVCESGVEIGAITNQKVLQLYHQNPKFGFYLFRLVLQRMLENERLRRAESGAARPLEPR
jgi:CRP/FNR family transcriptional regulator, cyclic AMP receptor protein